MAAPIIKTDMDGNRLWMKTFEHPRYLYMGSWIVSCTDGGYAMIGSRRSMATNGVDAYFVKTDDNGDILSGISEERLEEQQFNHLS